MLDEILASCRRRLAETVARESEWRQRAALAPPARDFAASLRPAGLSVIAEFKRKSPSAGTIGEKDPAILAAAYERGGAAALSVLTEPEWFGARPDDLRRARTATGLPVLRKDFILHSAQVWEARAMSADAVLAIVAALSDDELASIMAAAGEAGMGVVVEAHDEAEVESALAAGAEIVGINNRNLTSFETDLDTAERLRPLLPSTTLAVAESGVGGWEEAQRMAAAGFNAILVGEAAMRAEDPAAFVRSLRDAA